MCVLVCMCMCVCVDRLPGMQAAEIDTEAYRQSRAGLLCVNFRPATAAVITALNVRGAVHPCWPHFISSFHNQLISDRAVNEP